MTIKERAAESYQAIRKAIFLRQDWYDTLSDELEKAYNAGVSRGVSLAIQNNKARGEISTMAALNACDGV